MWIMTKNGFLSAVKKTPGEKITVRARRLDDIKYAAKRMGLEPEDILKNAGTDYPYRIVVPQAEFARFMAQEAHDIDYANFKDAACAGDKKRHDAYFKCWEALWRL